MARRPWFRLPADVRRKIIRLAAQGATYPEVVEQLGVSIGTVSNVLRPLGGVYRRDRPPSPHRLSVQDRVEIRIGLERGLTYRQIGVLIGRHASTVCREVNRHGGRDHYQPLAADRAAHEAARRPKATKLAQHPRLCARVTHDLERLWSPRQIAARLRREFGDDATMTISHETIYQSLYVQGRGELRRELTRCLRTGRASRRPRNRNAPRERIRDKVLISQRPAEVQDRAVPGHWEGDLILGANGNSQIGTLVERTTRFVLLLHLPTDRTAEAVRDAMTAAIQQLPAALRRSITWDQGIELAQHLQFTIDTGVVVDMCDTPAPRQRGPHR
jgi:transposase, IS30 family